MERCFDNGNRIEDMNFFSPNVWINANYIDIGSQFPWNISQYRQPDARPSTYYDYQSSLPHQPPLPFCNGRQVLPLIAFDATAAL